MTAVPDRAGNVRARCPGCEGSVSTFEAKLSTSNVHGGIQQDTDRPGVYHWYILLRCAGCGRGGLAQFMEVSNGTNRPERSLVDFYPRTPVRAQLPSAVPTGIESEFREAEKCIAAGCMRAAGALFRSVLDKTFRDCGYSKKLHPNITDAVADGVLTEVRGKRAHDELRDLGNDILHDEWRRVSAAEVEAAQHYAQRILEDLYDDRPAVVAKLTTVGRLKG